MGRFVGKCWSDLDKKDPHQNPFLIYIYASCKTLPICHSRRALERESGFLQAETISPIESFGDDKHFCKRLICVKFKEGFKEFGEGGKRDVELIYPLPGISSGSRNSLP